MPFCFVVLFFKWCKWFFFVSYLTPTFSLSAIENLNIQLVEMLCSFSCFCALPFTLWLPHPHAALETLWKTHSLSTNSVLHWPVDASFSFFSLYSNFQTDYSHFNEAYCVNDLVWIVVLSIKRMQFISHCCKCSEMQLITCM